MQKYVNFRADEFQTVSIPVDQVSLPLGLALQGFVFSSGNEVQPLAGFTDGAAGRKDISGGGQICQGLRAGWALGFATS